MEIAKKIKVSEPQNEVLNARGSIIADIAGQGAGKTVTIALSVGWRVLMFPDAKGFIGANTYKQLSNSTLTRLFFELQRVYGLAEYDRKSNPKGHYVVHVKPPGHWKKSKYRFDGYNGIMSFRNGATVFLGSLDNYKMHDGKEFAWAELDETKDTKKEALTTVILGRLRQYGLWVDSEGNVTWNPETSQQQAEDQGLKAWNPCCIHTSPAEGPVDWLIDLLGIAPYHKEIIETIVKDDDFFYKKIINVDEKTKRETETTVVISSSYHNEHNLPPGFIEDRKSRLSKSEALKFIYGNPFSKGGGEFFPAFDRLKHVKKLEYDPKLAVSSTWDFNATPYVTCLCTHVEYVTRFWDPVAKKKYIDFREGLEKMEVLRIRVFREYCLEPPEDGTEATAERFADDFVDSNPDVFIDGDANGRSRIEGMGQLTQYQIIEKRFRARGLYLSVGYLRVPRTNMRNRMRRDIMNRIWEEKMPEVEIEIGDNCPNTIRDCEYLLKGADGAKHKETEKDKNGIKFQELGHCADALEYLVCPMALPFFKE